jgi:N-acetylglucosaminyldiphosphoundecaprenol N-acetyl-beta-D-mannosaminyltransferase
MNDLRILGVRLTAQTYQEAIDRLLGATRRSEHFRVHFCTVHTLVEATVNPLLHEALDSAQMVAMDGLPLVWLSHRRASAPAERVCGPDVMLSICDRGRALGLRHFMIGGQPGVPERLAAKLSERYPGLEVVGVESPPFRDISTEEDEALVQRINAVTPDVVWVGLGSPKQELWAADHQDRLSTSLILPVGAAFDFHSGRLQRAPTWIQRFGLEWFFRLAMEPRRLFKRYLVTNFKFVVLVIREELSRRRGRS